MQASVETLRVILLPKIIADFSVNKSVCTLLEKLKVFVSVKFEVFLCQIFFLSISRFAKNSTVKVDFHVESTVVKQATF